MKNKLDWYKHEVDSHNHWKFKILRRKFGWAGEGKFWALNNLIAKSEFCTLDLTNENKLQQISIELDFDVPELMEFLSYLADTCKLVMMKEMVISTQMTQENLDSVLAERERKREYKKHKEEPAPSGEKTGNAENRPENQEIDVEKEKVDGEISQRREEKSRVDNKEPKGSTETPVSVPSDEEEKILKAEYKKIAGDVEMLTEFIRTKKPRFIEPYVRRWNFFAADVGVCRVKEITAQRKRKFKTRIREAPFDFIGVLEKAGASDFMLNGNWFSFDWIFANADNYVKTLEGKYDNNKKPFIQKKATNEILEERKRAKERIESKH